MSWRERASARSIGGWVTRASPIRGRVSAETLSLNKRVEEWRHLCGLLKALVPGALPRSLSSVYDYMISLLIIYQLEQNRKLMGFYGGYKNKKNWKKIICRALGSKCSKDDKQSDYCCYLRLSYVVANLIAIVAIVSNAIHQW